MAVARFFNATSYGQFEPNNCAFPRDGRVEAQCKPGSDFSSALPLENGMLVAVDKPAGKITLAAQTETRPIGIVYSAEKLYDQHVVGLRNFKNDGVDGFYPRVGYLSVGDTFTTNCVAADNSTYTNEAAFINALDGISGTALYGGYTTDLGAILVAATPPAEGPVLSVVKRTTMPDGSHAVKFQVTKA